MENLKSFDPLFSIHLQADLIVESDEIIRLEFAWKDMQGQIIMPTQPSAGRHHDLWQQTCFEAFIRPKIGIGYFEVNLSPTGAWNIYRFESYRSPQPPTEFSEAEVLEITPQQESLNARIKLPDLDLTLVEVSLCAIFKLKNGTTSYWANRHSAHKPDFHYPDSFILERKSP